MDTPNKQGVSRRQGLESLKKQMVLAGKSKQYIEERCIELLPVKLERGTETLVNTFNQLSTRRSYGMNGPQPITFTEIQAFDLLTGANLTAWEVETLTSMDSIFISKTYQLSDS
jgi:hypothetical protein